MVDLLNSQKEVGIFFFFTGVRYNENGPADLKVLPTGLILLESWPCQ